MSIYTPALVPLATLRQHRRLQTDEMDDDLLLQRFIREASEEFARAVGRTLMPYAATRVYDYDRNNLSSEYAYRAAFDFSGSRGVQKLRTGEDLLAVTAIVNGDGTTIGASDYILRPNNEYPKYEITLKNGLAWVPGDTPEGCISITGTWGYVPHYPRAWVTVATLSADMANSATSITQTSPRLFSPLQYIRIDSEVMQVVAVESTITLTRGELGTTPAAHTANAAIAVFQPLPDVQSAVCEMAAYKYKHKDSLGARVTVYDGGTVTSEDMAKSVYETIARHRSYVVEVI